MKKLLIICMLILCSHFVKGQDFSKERLENSPRHHEWVNIENKGRQIRAFLVFPETSKPTKSIIVIHENRGLTDWVRGLADQLAEMGFIALAPDLLSDFNENIKSTRDFQDQDAAREGIYQLDQDQVLNDLDKAFEYLQSLDAGNGEVSVIGFCWGGSQAFRYATHQDGLQEALVFYGTGPKSKAEIDKIEVPVYGFYGENDQRVNATIEQTASLMERFNNPFIYEIYDGAGHAYMRSGEDPQGSEENKKAREKSLARIKSILE